LHLARSGCAAKVGGAQRGKKKPKWRGGVPIQIGSGVAESVGNNNWGIKRIPGGSGNQVVECPHFLKKRSENCIQKQLRSKKKKVSEKRKREMWKKKKGERYGGGASH